MTPADKPGYVAALRSMWARHAKESSDAPTQETMRAWWEALERYDLAAVEVALRRAVEDPSADPRWRPTCEQVRRLAAIEQTRRDGDRRARIAAQAATDRPALPPGPIAGAAARVAAQGLSPWERLARLWEAEDAHAGRGRTAPTPAAVGKARWADFWGVWRQRENATVANGKGPGSDFGGHERSGMSNDGEARTGREIDDGLSDNTKEVIT